MPVRSSTARFTPLALFTVALALTACTACTGGSPGDGLRDWVDDQDWGSNIDWDELGEDIDWGEVQDDANEINWPDWGGGGEGSDDDDTADTYWVYNAVDSETGEPEDCSSSDNSGTLVGDWLVVWMVLDGNQFEMPYSAADFATSYSLTVREDLSCTFDLTTEDNGSAETTSIPCTASVIEEGRYGLTSPEPGTRFPLECTQAGNTMSCETDSGNRYELVR